MDYSLESDYVRQLDRDILEYVNRGLDTRDDEGFNTLAMREFELTYAAYDQFQGKMEHYWCLRWLLQEQVTLSKAQVLRDNLVKFERIPLYVRVHSLPELEVGSRVLLEIEGIDLIDNSVKARYKGPAEG